MRGLFTIPKENNFEGNIHQHVCNTSKNQYNSTNGEIALFGLSFTEDEQIGKWVSRSNERFKQSQMPKTVHGMMDVNNSGVQFNFLKSLEITNINEETLLLHPSVSEFCEQEETRKNLLDFQVSWSRNPLVT